MDESRRNHTRGTALPDTGPCGAGAPPGPVSAPFPRASAGGEESQRRCGRSPGAPSFPDLRFTASLLRFTRSSFILAVSPLRSDRSIPCAAAPWSTRSPRQTTGDTARRSTLSRLQGGIRLHGPRPGARIGSAEHVRTMKLSALFLDPDSLRSVDLADAVWFIGDRPSGALAGEHNRAFHAIHQTQKPASLCLVNGPLRRDTARASP